MASGSLEKHLFRILPDFAEVYSFSYCFLQVLVQLKLPFNLRINIWYYRAPEIIFGATKYTTAIDICSSLCLLVRVE
ncbi:hypothetical protein ERO13_A04G042601v2 [Gossypium hirsutum]|uniref:Protein kinase domain-containing protein n=1 Tax=Gossypium tomentosum TaxID=34277 RepID=A0A5D2QY39_GOSTO|nr:hypothetical protein ERO13_A04G042601v2 [Gossypium hirsutum]TYI32385.1 hypothetical protein ES332_A04G056800v1 [Gossypium tomentosum]